VAPRFVVTAALGHELVEFGLVLGMPQTVEELEFALFFFEAAQVSARYSSRRGCRSADRSLHHRSGFLMAALLPARALHPSSAPFSAPDDTSARQGRAATTPSHHRERSRRDCRSSSFAASVMRDLM
jgi:hypothetical protein